MNLYLISRRDRVGYDEYDSFVIAAESENECRVLAIDDQDIYKNYGDWMNANVHLLASGVDEMSGVILGSLNAG